MHRVHVLDTRTRRQYLTPYASPGLLTQQALDDQLPPTEQLPDDHVLIVVSPAPVFGPPVMTELGGPVAASEYDIATFARSATYRSLNQQLTGLENGRPLGSQFYDAEHWGAQPAAFERLLARLSQYKRVVVLGGDVHYAGAYAMDWSGSARDSRIIHFTSSAAHNAWKDVVRTRLGHKLAWVDERLAGRSFLVGDHFTVADAYLVVVLAWSRLVGIDLASYPHLAAYRVPRFSDTPEIEVEILDRKDLPPAGAGETAIVGLAPAVGNAIFAATGIRLRSLPMAPDGLPKSAAKS